MARPLDRLDFSSFLREITQRCWKSRITPPLGRGYPFSGQELRVAALRPANCTTRAKPDLIPDCDVHGVPMYRDQCRGRELGLKDGRDVVVWRCAHQGCGRYFLGTLGYRSCLPGEDDAPPTPRCAREGAFLVVQRAWNLSICPVDGCSTRRPWHAPDLEMVEEPLAAA